MSTQLTREELLAAYRTHTTAWQEQVGALDQCDTDMTLALAGAQMDDPALVLASAQKSTCAISKRWKHHGQALAEITWLRTDIQRIGRAVSRNDNYNMSHELQQLHDRAKTVVDKDQEAMLLLASG